MILGVDPKVDYAFKHLLGREATRPILIDVVDNVLNPAPGRHIQTIDLLNPFNPKETSDDKLSILDIKARDQSGRQFNVEMQMLAFPYYDKRIIYYWAKFHQQQLQEGNDYQVLKPTVSISFLNHVLFEDVPNYHLCFRLVDESQHVLFGEDMEFHILELPKFKKTAAELTNGLDIWLYFLRHAEMMDTEALPAALLQYPLATRAVEELKIMTQNDVERERYEARRKAQLDHNTIMKAARMEGRAEGLLDGRATGEKIGMIHAFERLLQRRETPTEQLAQLSLEALAHLADDLQAHLLKQR